MKTRPFIKNQRLILKPELTKNKKRSWMDDDLEKVKGPLVISDFYDDYASLRDLGNENKRISVLYANLQIDPKDKRRIPKEIDGIINDLTSNFPKVHFEDRGTGGYSLRNFSTEGNIFPVFIDHESKEIGFELPNMGDKIDRHQIENILNGVTNQAKRSFQATEHTHINRTWTFFKAGEKLPKQESYSW